MFSSTEVRALPTFGTLSVLAWASCVVLVSCTVGCTGDAFFTGEGAGGAAAGGAGATSSGGDGARSSGGNGGDFGTGGLGDPCPGGGVCVPQAPDGWEGPVALVQSGTGPVGFSGEFPLERATLVAEPTDEPYECAACSCGDPSNQACQLEQGESYPGDNCSGSPAVLPTPAEDCNAFPAAGNIGSIEYPNGVLTSPGSCAPQGGGASGKPSAFDQDVTLCDVAGSAPSCGAGDNACLPAPEGPFANTYCIYRPGDVECPDNTYKKDLHYNEEGTDGRDCSDCECEVPSGPCSATIGVYAGCDGALVASGLTGTCIVASVTGGGIKLLELEPVACAASGGEPIGQANLGSEVTVCCIDSSG